VSAQVAPISVVMAAYNSGAYIGPALDSVRAQTLPVAEVIVVDDGSADGSAKVAEAHGARVIRQANAGVSTARNVGIQAATQEWIAFLDHDDLWEPGKIKAQWAATQAVPEAGMVACDFLQFRGDEVVTPSFLGLPGRYHGINKEPVSEGLALIRRADRAYVEAGFFLFPSVVMARKDVLVAAGLFNPELPGGAEDFEFFWRVLKRTALLVVERPLVRWRIHATNTSGDGLRMNLKFVLVADRVARAPERYPEAAVRHCRRTLPGVLLDAARIHLLQGEPRAARPLLWRSLTLRPRPRTAAYWALSWLGAGSFTGLRRALGRGPDPSPKVR